MVILEGASIGWAAAICAMACNGSYGVPIKSETCRRLDIDPLVFQTYKTVMCVIFAFTAVLLTGTPMNFSPWGIISGLFWVPAGTAVILAVKLLGLAVGMAVANSLIALVTFVWGIYIFQEPIHSKPVACFGVLMMVTGFVGMSYFSSLDNGTNTQSELEEPLIENDENCPSIISVMKRTKSEDESLDGTLTDSDDSSHGSNSHNRRRRFEKARSNVTNESPTLNVRNRKSSFNNNRTPANEELPLRAMDWFYAASAGTQIRPSCMEVTNTSVIICDREYCRFRTGLFVAVMAGLWGGSVMIPMKLCQQNTSGLLYLISFSLGSLLVTMIFWLLRLVVSARFQGSIQCGYQALPSFHFREMLVPGGLSGLLWSIGNCFGILAVQHLGTGVGFCTVQSSMLVAGIWGIVYFKEITGRYTILKWFLSALVTVGGIGLLAYEKGAY